VQERVSPHEQDAHRLLTVQEVATHCGLSEKAIYRAIERGELCASRLCSRLRVRGEEVDAWISRSAIAHEPLPNGRREPRRMDFSSPNGLRSMLADTRGKTR
jgi:excisionase family DNA binding protein